MSLLTLLDQAQLTGCQLPLEQAGVDREVFLFLTAEDLGALGFDPETAGKLLDLQLRMHQQTALAAAPSTTELSNSPPLSASPVMTSEPVMSSERATVLPGSSDLADPSETSTRSTKRLLASQRLSVISARDLGGEVTLTAEDVKDPLHQGWLWKRGQRGKTWKKRWCVLKGRWLYYFPTRKKTPCKGAYYLPDWGLVEAGDLREHALMLSRGDETPPQAVVFAPKTKEEFATWWRHLEEANRPPPPLETEGGDAEDDDARELLRMGYKQELLRGVNFAMSLSYSFTVCAIVPGISQLYTFGLQAGGPAVMSKLFKQTPKPSTLFHFYLFFLFYFIFFFSHFFSL